MKYYLPILLIALALIGSAYWFWPVRPAAAWEPSLNTLVIEIAYLEPQIDITYIPEVRIWGDGRIVWKKYDANYNRQVMIGYLSPEVMTKILRRFINIGFFDRSFIGDFDTLMESSVKVNLLSHKKDVRNCVKWVSQRDPALMDYLISGAETNGTPFSPTEGTLFVHLYVPSSYDQVSYQWPDDKFNYELHDRDERQLVGEELEFAWKVVNSSLPLVRSGGKVYWVSVRVPKVSLY